MSLLPPLLCPFCESVLLHGWDKNPDEIHSPNFTAGGKKRGQGVTILYSFLRWGNREGGADPFFLRSSERCGNALKLCRGSSGWTSGNIPLPRERSNTRTGFLERWSMPWTCQCFRGIWTMALTTGLNLWSALDWSSSWTRCSLQVLSNWNSLFYCYFLLLN